MWKSENINNSKPNISTTTHFWEMNNSAFESSIIEVSFWLGEPLSPPFQNFLRTAPPLGAHSALWRLVITTACNWISTHHAWRVWWLKVKVSYAASILGKNFFCHVNVWPFFWQRRIFWRQILKCRFKPWGSSSWMEWQQNVKKVASYWLWVLGKLIWKLKKRLVI